MGSAAAGRVARAAAIATHLLLPSCSPSLALLRPPPPFPLRCPRRKLGEHVLYESDAWVNCVQAEVHLMHMLLQGLLHTLIKAAETGACRRGSAAWVRAV